MRLVVVVGSLCGAIAFYYVWNVGAHMHESTRRGDAVIQSERQEGTLVSIMGDYLTMICKNKKEQGYTLAKDVKIIGDGKTCTAADLKQGMKLRLTTTRAAAPMVTRLEALHKNISFTQGR